MLAALILFACEDIYLSVIFCNIASQEGEGRVKMVTMMEGRRHEASAAASCRIMSHLHVDPSYGYMLLMELPVPRSNFHCFIAE